MTKTLFQPKSTSTASAFCRGKSRLWGHLASSRLVTMTWIPGRASWRQISKPMPRLAPVTTAIALSLLIVAFDSCDFFAWAVLFIIVANGALVKFSSSINVVSVGRNGLTEAEAESVIGLFRGRKRRSRTGFEQWIAVY